MSSPDIYEQTHDVLTQNPDRDTGAQASMGMDPELRAIYDSLADNTVEAKWRQDLITAGVNRAVASGNYSSLFEQGLMTEEQLVDNISHGYHTLDRRQLARAIRVEQLVKLDEKEQEQERVRQREHQACERYPEYATVLYAQYK